MTNRMRAHRRAQRVRRVRRGFTLAELMIVVVLLALVGSALMQIIVRQQRFFRSAGDLLDLRSQLRQASASISSDLRGVSAKAGDIIAATDSSIDFRQTFGSSAICKINNGGGQIVLPPVTLASGAIITSWLTTPVASDKVLVLDEGPTNEGADDIWQKDSVTSFSAALNTCPTAAGNLTGVADAASNSYTVNLSTNLPATVQVGAPVRFYHRAHYSLYQSGDGNWYLGFCSPDCGTSPIQAIAGPFLAYNVGGTGGLTFSYYDANGNATTTLTAINRIRIVIRGQTRSQVDISGTKKQQVVDSVKLSVAIRNR